MLPARRRPAADAAPRRLHDVLHSDKKLTLVFEFCDQVSGALRPRVSSSRALMAASPPRRTSRSISTAATGIWTLRS